MIYRFQSAQKPTLKQNHQWHFPRFGGCFAYGALDIDVPVPNCKSIHDRARFYFTELGYKRNAHIILACAKERGQVLKVIRLKEPDESRVVYRDKWQVAVLPQKKRKR